MSADSSGETTQTELTAVMELIGDLVRKSDGGNFIFRGERKVYERVSSSLWRLYKEIEAEGFDIEVVQAEILNEARSYTRYTGEVEDLEILSQLQHNGGATNLIDFTTDYLIALFFACDGEPEKSGRVIVLPESRDDFVLEYPSHPVHRVVAQKSVFVRPQKGLVEKFECVPVPNYLKPAILDYLRTRHGISAESIYNDLHGFIKYQGIHRSAYAEFYKAMTWQNNENHQKAIEHYTNAITLAPQMAASYNNRGVAYLELGNYRLAIADYEKALELDPDDVAMIRNLGIAYSEQGSFSRAIPYYTRAIEMEEYPQTYYNRGEARLHMGEWVSARQDLIEARNNGIDIASLFHRIYPDIDAFEQATNLKLPDDIATILSE